MWRLARLCSDVTFDDATVTGGNPLDRALWEAADGPDVGDVSRRSALPFDHDRQLTSVLVDDPHAGRTLITKGAPEAVIRRCRQVPAEATEFLEAQFADGLRVIAVASRLRPDLDVIDADDESDLELAGFVTFLDPPKPDVAASLARLIDLGISVKIVTGDHPTVARHLCDQIGLDVAGVLSGAEIERLDDEALAAALPTQRCSDESHRTRRVASFAPNGHSAPPLRFSETESTTPSHCTSPTWASPSTPQPMSPKTPPASC